MKCSTQPWKPLPLQSLPDPPFDVARRLGRNIRVKNALKKVDINLSERERALQALSAEERVRWALETFASHVALSSSFGIQSAVLLHIVTQQAPDIPVVLVDTGYLFPETYQFIDELTGRLKLNLKIYRARTSPAWQEARYGKLWEQGLEGIERYNHMNKVEPMMRALDELDVWAWMVGLRRQQSDSRRELGVLAVQWERIKVHPIVDWTSRDVFQYLKQHDLPYHPLWEQGYVSLGDVHTTEKLSPGMTEEETRFFGLKRECGLHDDADYSI
jgi:phosphoadenosine phosphosulfate reductase